MTHISKTTKAELAAQVAEYDEALAVVSEERDSLAAQLKAAKPARVPEADALASCIRALDGIPAIRTPRAWNSSEEPDRGAVRRVLVHLAERYGVPLIEVTTEPCSRQHLDEVDGFALQAALRGAVVHP